MSNLNPIFRLCLSLLSFFFLAASVFAQPSISLAPIGTYATGAFDEGAAEIAAFDVKTKRLYVTNAQANTVDVVNISTPSAPVLDFTIDLSPYGGGVNSVATWYGTIAVAVEDTIKQAPGRVVFFDRNGQYLNQLTVGALPDMLTFTPDGEYLLVANEGEPSNDYSVDPEGSVSIIKMKKAKNLSQSDVMTADFTAFNGTVLDPSIRIFGPGATVAQDLEPEYIAVADNSQVAWVTLQENNAIAEINIKNATVTAIRGLGFKDHSLPGNGMDVSNSDALINITNWPVKGVYMPDAVDFLFWANKSYLITANEGDAREYTGAGGLVEAVRVSSSSVVLDPTAFPNAATLKSNTNLGRLNITKTMGNTDGDNDFDELYSFGARSFTIWRTDGQFVYDSGDDFEQITAALYPADFNSNNDDNGSFDSRSDDKGPEPEGLVIGKVKGRTYLFVGLERIGGVMVYDITNPNTPVFVQYVNNRDFAGDAEAGTAGDLGPEGMIFIKDWQSPTQNPLLVVTNEVSGSTTVYEITDIPNTNREAGLTENFTASATLLPNAPNPFRGFTDISFNLSENSQVEITLFDLNGKKVSDLAASAYAAGTHTLRWNATDESGQKVAPGVYLCLMRTAKMTTARKIIYQGE
ncbi:MAG: choice-of-anchor I family protein [Bacteroidia bacterium]|nr:choice-of-anchor I family protein [Bacteroidia bacterium]